MPLDALAKAIQKMLGLQRPPSRASIRAWRDDPDYQHYVEFAASEIKRALSGDAKLAAELAAFRAAPRPADSLSLRTPDPIHGAAEID
jgi:hypothetical protein